VEVKKPITRREFLKLAARAGAALGFGAGLGGVVGSCGEKVDVSNTIATIAGVETGTTATTSAERGRDIRIGVVSAGTGTQALFGKADQWWMEYAGVACPEGVLCGDNRVHRFVFSVEDSRSDSDVAAQGAENLISNAEVDMITCSGGVNVINAVAERAEALGCPCLTSFHQWRPFVSRHGHDPQTPFKWTYAHALGLEDIVANYVAMWEQVVTNRKVGLVVTDDDQARMWADPSLGLPPVAGELGYQVVIAEPLLAGAGDCTDEISLLMKEGCEICCAVMSPEDLFTFWRGSSRLGFRPKVVTTGLALLFPHALEAMGSGARDFTAESLWQPDWPYTDSITGSPAAVLAEDYVARTGEQWIAPLAQYAKFEWAVDIYRRVKDLDNKETVVEQVRRTRLETCLGPIDFTAPLDTPEPGMGRRPSDNVCKAPVAGAQWVGGGALKFRPVTVANSGWPEIPVTGAMRPMTYE
jgi:branched-chain amino acid transport system substrate-binding protein